MLYYQCPECGYKQRSKAKERIKCHKCGNSYLKRKAKKFRRKKGEKEPGFYKYSKKNEKKNEDNRNEGGKD